MRKGTEASVCVDGDLDVLRIHNDVLSSASNFGIKESMEDNG